MSAHGLDWIEQLPAELDGQRAILLRLLRACEADERIRWLAIACSLGRGAADRLSDLDMAVGIRDAEFNAAFDDVWRAVDGLGELVESYHHKIAGVTSTHQRIFAQYADRCQVDLVVFTASEPIGSVRDLVVLYDPDGQVTAAADRQPAAGSSPITPQQIREWAFGGWCALADLGKYSLRGSAWEALDRLNEARSQAWKIWAVVLEVPNPQYGLTSILDFAPDRMPTAMRGAVSDLDPDRLLSAARTVAGQLEAACASLPADLRPALPTAMARFIADDLASLMRGCPLSAARG
jgi:hypothetical protein